MCNAKENERDALPKLPDQSYIEDCSVCCRPINITTTIDFDENVYISAKHEDE